MSCLDHRCQLVVISCHNEFLAHGHCHENVGMSTCACFVHHNVVKLCVSIGDEISQCQSISAAERTENGSDRFEFFTSSFLISFHTVSIDTVTDSVYQALLVKSIWIASSDDRVLGRIFLYVILVVVCVGEILHQSVDCAVVHRTYQNLLLVCMSNLEELCQQTRFACAWWTYHQMEVF